MSDRFYTLMLVPEKSSKVRKFSIPVFYIRLASIFAAFFVLLGLFIVFDYIHVLSQVAENKKLRTENRILKINIEQARGQLDTLDDSVSRLKSFAQKLRVLRNLDSPTATSRLLQAPPESKNNAPGPGGEEDSGTIDIQENHSMLQMENDLILSVEAIENNAANLNTIVIEEEKGFAVLYEELKDSVDRLLHTPSILPAQGWISSRFGHRVNPFFGTKTFHGGLDIANRYGTPIHAPANGVVTFAGMHGGFGLIVQINHGYDIVTKYGHNSKSFVKVGDRVTRGQKIAEMGSTGRSTGTHLHYQVEVKKRPVDPDLFILDDTFVN